MDLCRRNNLPMCLPTSTANDEYEVPVLSVEEVLVALKAQ